MVTLWAPQILNRFLLVYNLFPVGSRVAFKVPRLKASPKRFRGRKPCLHACHYRINMPHSIDWCDLPLSYVSCNFYLHLTHRNELTTCPDTCDPRKKIINSSECFETMNSTSFTVERAFQGLTSCFGQTTLPTPMFRFVSFPDRVRSALIKMWRARKICLWLFFPESTWQSIVAEPNTIGVNKWHWT